MGLPAVLPLVAHSVGQVLQIFLGGNPFVNTPVAGAMCLGQHLADPPIIQTSVDPCCSCTDRSDLVFALARKNQRPGDTAATSDWQMGRWATR